MTVGEFLGRRDLGDGRIAFDLAPAMRGASGGVFGGAVAACCVQAARSVAPELDPLSLDCRFVRALPAGRAEARALTVAADRTTTTVQVAVTGRDGAVASVATVSLVSHGSLAAVEHEIPVEPSAGSYADALPWSGPGGIPLPETLAPRTLAQHGTTVTSAIVVPWTADTTSAAEAACLVGDLCVGPPVAAALRTGRVSHPNPDLSLRFCGDDLAEEVYGTGRLVRLDTGVATVEIEVFSRRRLLAAGVSTSLLHEPRTDN